MKSLNLFEWSVLLIITGAIVTLIGIGIYSEFQKEVVVKQYQKQKLEKGLIAVELKGAVKKPGIYYVHPGTSLSQVVKSSGLKKNANRKQIPLKKILYSSEVIEISSIKE